VCPASSKKSNLQPLGKQPPPPRANHRQYGTKWGVQPVHGLLRKTGWSLATVSRELSVPYQTLVKVCSGTTIPPDDLRTMLAVFLGLPVEELFTREVLARKYQSRWGDSR
jgi:lambda repressor-like predicted transcriptional regulator